MQIYYNFIGNLKIFNIKTTHISKFMATAENVNLNLFTLLIISETFVRTVFLKEVSNTL